jgi:sugar phosphate isomerase/epimerase
MNTTTDTITATDTDTLADNLRMLEAMLADIAAAGPDSHGAFRADAIMADIRKQVAALMDATDDAHARMATIGHAFGV